MPYINGSEMFLHLCLFVVFWSRTTHLHSIYLLSSSLNPPPLPLPLLSCMAVQSDSPLAQCWPITPHPNQGAGWRRWPVLEGPLTRYQFESWRPSRSMKRSRRLWTTMTNPSWILFTSAGLHGTTGAGLRGTHFVVFVTPLSAFQMWTKSKGGLLFIFQKDQFVSI